VFLRFRDDKKPEECIRQGSETSEPVTHAPRPTPHAPLEREIKFTNLNKILWPDDAYTKGDLFDYYRAISPWLLPYLKDRPLVLTRYPDGIDGKFFFQKDARGLAPPWIRTERMWSEDTQRDIDYFIADDVDTLLFLANLGTIPLHVWASRVPD